MPKLLNVFSILRAAWTFQRKQPVLGSIVVWLFFLPVVVSDGIDRSGVLDALIPDDQVRLAVSFILLAAVAVLTAWGAAATLLVGRRLIHKGAGRSRTSFRSAQRQSLTLVPRLIGTGILNACAVAERAALLAVPALAILLAGPVGGTVLAGNRPGDLGALISRHPLLVLTPVLLLPAIAYAVRASLYQAAVGVDGLMYRPALRQSVTRVRGRFWTVTGNLLGVGGLLFGPVLVLSLILEPLTSGGSPFGGFTGDVVVDGLDAAAGMLFILCTVELYGRLQPQGKKGAETVPDDLDDDA